MLRRLACLSLVLNLCAAAHAQPAQQTAETKATYLYKLTPFVEWPATHAGRSFNLCVVGPDPFGPALDEAVAGQAYGGRPFAVVRLTALEAPDTCDVVYAGGSPEQVAETLRASRGHAILTVTDDSPTAGMIDFTLHEGKIRFRIDQAAAEASGLSISSKLLSLALTVHVAGTQP